MINLAAVPPLPLTTDVLALIRRRMAKGRIIPAFLFFGDGALPTKAERAIFIFGISQMAKEKPPQMPAAAFHFKRCACQAGDIVSSPSWPKP
ncbi:hypothetical protein [Rhizobium multihospitium]|uniref:hypothetical protein n=1 Tax=Rhizobium multihospitium TaxID=410764 RepID=UPI00114CF1DF|nr:hypothetical protein [Rhizobium multihospitium]